ncbi:hypothetical protein ACFFX0_16580 [Citricoccus parietis]|uniref:Uncharacterized protein n=1 Tax=Citricoccus parietis TaxID=592307 RepID=A0ABV5G1B7_9MICC
MCPEGAGGLERLRGRLDAGEPRSPPRGSHAGLRVELRAEHGRSHPARRVRARSPANRWWCAGLGRRLRSHRR